MFRRRTRKKDLLNNADAKRGEKALQSGDLGSVIHAADQILDREYNDETHIGQRASESAERQSRIWRRFRRKEE